MKTHYTLTLAAALCSVTLFPSCSEDDLVELVNDVAGDKINEETVPANAVNYPIEIKSDNGLVTLIDFTSDTTATVTVTGAGSMDIAATYAPQGEVVAGRSDKADAVLVFPGSVIGEEGEITVTVTFSNHYNSAVVTNVQTSDFDMHSAAQSWAVSNFQTDGTNGGITFQGW